MEVKIFVNFNFYDKVIDMKLKTSLINFFKPSKKKVLMILIFPFIAVFTLLFGFFLDEILGWGGSILVNSIYSLGGYIFLITFLPFKFFDVDFSSIPIGLFFILTIIWWYFLSCLLIFIKNSYFQKHRLKSPPGLKNSTKNDK